MMEQKYLKPRDGLLVRLEDGMGYVDAGGQLLPLSAYYLRRLADGDLIEAVEAKAKGK